MFIISRYINFYKKNGLVKTLTKIISTPYRIFEKNLYKRKKRLIFSKIDKKEKFDLIYKKNFWSSKESVSGLGSELKNTINLRNELTKIFKEFKFNKILDAPCGDFNWIRLIIKDDIEYLGGDIVDDLISNNEKKYKSKNINFTKLDITKDNIPDSDLMICRDCLIHLSYESINSFLSNFRKSKIDYLLLTNYELKNNNIEFINIDIPDGEFREIDLSKKPFNFPEPIRKIKDKDEQTIQSGFNCYMNLYSKKQILDLSTDL